MPLRNIGSTGSGKPFCKYNVKSGKWFVRGADGQDKEIVLPTFVADFDNARTGWLKFREGQRPERVMHPPLGGEAPCPGEGFKRGFVVQVFNRLLGGVLEFSSTSSHVGDAINEVYAPYEKDRDAHPGELPVIACSDSQTMKDPHGTNYRPIFAIVKWVARPAELLNVPAVSPDEVYKGNGSVPEPTRVHERPPPEPRRPPAPLDDDIL